MKYMSADQKLCMQTNVFFSNDTHLRVTSPFCRHKLSICRLKLTQGRPHTPHTPQRWTCSFFLTNKQRENTKSLFSSKVILHLRAKCTFILCLHVKCIFIKKPYRLFYLSFEDLLVSITIGYLVKMPPCMYCVAKIGSLLDPTF